MNIFDEKNALIISSEFAHINSIYFNSAYFGPSPIRAKASAVSALEKELDPSYYAYETYIKIPDQIRNKLGTFLACPAENIALSTSVTDIIGIVANGLQLKYDEVVCSFKGEYPSNVLPWMWAQENKKLKFSLLDLPPVLNGDWLQKNLPANTKVLNLSHVSFNTGRKVDLLSLGEFCQKKEILFVVDCTQSLGGMQISPQELKVIDVLACAGYKWLLGPYGQAFAYFSDKAMEQIRQFTSNWIVSPNSQKVYSLLNYTTKTLPGAKKYDRGQTPNMLTMGLWDGVLDFFNSISMEQVTRHNNHLTQYFIDHVPLDKFQLITPLKERGNILCLRSLGGDPLKLEEGLKERNIDVSIREGNLRLSFHLFNTLEQVDTLLDSLKVCH